MALDLPLQPWQLGAVRVEWQQLRLVSDARVLRITPKAAAVLSRLLQPAGATVARRALFDAVWPGSFSSDEVLTQVVAELRRAFDAADAGARPIETVPKLGYRWVGPAPLPLRPDEPGVASHAIDAAAAPVASNAEEGAPPARRRRAWLPLAATLLLVGLALASFAAWRGLRPAARGATLPPAVPVTHEPGLDLDPDLDRDARRIAYVHVGVDVAELRVREVGASSFRTIALQGAGTVSAPAWSPDGRQLAFLWRDGARCEVRRVALADARVQHIAGGCPATVPTSVEWTADGRAVVYSALAQGATLAQRSVALYRSDVAGGPAQRISNAHRWLVVDAHPRLHRDGRTLAFVRDGDGANRLIVTTLDAPHVERKIALPMWAYRVDWLGDELIVAGHGRTAAELWRVDPRSGDAAPLDLVAVGPGLTTAARVLVVEQRRIDDNLWSLALDDAAASPRQVTRATRSELAPRISPDGRRLAYLADDHGVLDVFVQSLPDGARRRVSDLAPRSALDLRWSPDGTALALIVGGPEGKRVHVFDADGTAQRGHASRSERDIAQVEWSGDGRHLLLGVVVDGRRELRRVDYPAFESDELVQEASVFAFARDGDDLLFTRPDSAALYRLAPGAAPVPVDGVRIVAAPGDQWSVGGGHLAQLQQFDRGGRAALLLQRLDGSARREWRITAPSPPLGRNLDLGAGRLWYAQRDVDEADLVQLQLPR